MKKNTDSIISISGLTKQFGHSVVLSDMNLQIKRGDSIAFIGRNGCGKSTLLKIIAGVLPYNKGSVTHNGKLKFCYVPERFPAMSLTVRKYITQIGAIAGLSKKNLVERSTQLFEAFFMNNMIDTPIRYLSKGTIQKVAVVQAFLTKPDILLLDEPVSGQDMTSQRVFIDIVNNLNREHGVTVLSSCHEDYMIKAIAKTVYEISNGKLQNIEQKTTDGIDNLYKILFVKKSVYGENKILNIPQTVSNLAVKLEFLDKREVAVYAAALESDKIIREMLNDNFELRGLNNERIF